MSNQPFDEAYNSKPPGNYEQYFVPAIGEPLAKDLIRLAELQPGERILDVACGTGIVARLAAKKVGDKGTVAGLDVNPGMLAVARNVTEPDQSIDWYEAGAEAIPLPDETFDAVLCQMGLQFMTDQPAALREMRRVLVPGGRIIVNVPGPASKIFRELSKAMEQTISTEAAGFVNQVFSIHDTAEIQQLMNESGFKDVVTQAKQKNLSLPPPKAFLWQYIYSTPLAGLVAQADEKARTALEDEVLKRWKHLEKNGAMACRQRMVTATARR